MVVYGHDTTIPITVDDFVAIGERYLSE